MIVDTNCKKCKAELLETGIEQFSLEYKTKYNKMKSTCQHTLNERQIGYEPLTDEDYKKRGITAMTLADLNNYLETGEDTPERWNEHRKKCIIWGGE